MKKTNTTQQQPTTPTNRRTASKPRQDTALLALLEEHNRFGVVRSTSRASKPA